MSALLCETAKPRGWVVSRRRLRGSRHPTGPWSPGGMSALLCETAKPRGWLVSRRRQSSPRREQPPRPLGRRVAGGTPEGPRRLREWTQYVYPQACNDVLGRPAFSPSGGPLQSRGLLFCAAGRTHRGSQSLWVDVLRLTQEACFVPFRGTPPEPGAALLRCVANEPRIAPPNQGSVFRECGETARGC